MLFNDNSQCEITGRNDYSSYNESAKFADGINYAGADCVKLGVVGLVRCFEPHRTPVNGRDNQDGKILDPVLKHGPNTAYGGNARERASKYLVIFLLLALALSGCSSKPEVPTENSEVKPARSEVERGPVKVTIEVNPAKAQLSDEPVLTLSIDYEEGVKVPKPPFGGSLGGFVIRDFREPPPKIHDGRELIQQIYTLEPTETGKMLLDPISITFTDNRPNGDGQTHTLETEAVTVEITSIVGDKAPSLGELRPSAEPIELPSFTSPWLWSLAVSGVAALAIAWWLKRRRRREKLTRCGSSPTARRRPPACSNRIPTAPRCTCSTIPWRIAMPWR